MSLQHLIENTLITCSPTSSIKDVAKQMSSENVGAVLVVQDNKPVGIVTDRDIAIRCVAEGGDCERSTVDEIMTDTVVTATVDQGIFDVVGLMRENEIRRLPVVDQRGFAVGLVSFGDVFQLLAKEIYDLSAPATPERPKIVNAA